MASWRTGCSRIDGSRRSRQVPARRDLKKRHDWRSHLFLGKVGELAD